MSKFIQNISNHIRAYESININPVPPFRCTISEWRKEFLQMKQKGMVPPEVDWMEIAQFLGVQVELVIKFE